MEPLHRHLGFEEIFDILNTKNIIRSNNNRLGFYLVAIILMIPGMITPAWADMPKISERRTPTKPLSSTERVLVKFSTGTANARGSLAAAGFIQKGELATLGVHMINVPHGQTAEEVVTELQTRYGTQLAYAEPDRIRYVFKTPNDPLYSASSLYYLRTIQGPTAWDTTTGSGVTIAIADTGVTTTHPDLASHLLTGKNILTGTSDVTDHYGHGTAVAGMAAAIGDNAVGVTGVAYNASILPIKISDDGTTSDSIIAEAIVYAADQGAKVVNISFGDDSPAPAGCWGPTVISAAQYMRARGGLIVISAGNAGINKGCSNNAEIINVAATNSSDALASFSNFGSELDVAAPGVNVGTTNCDTCTGVGAFGFGDYVYGFNGTSFAAPVTAGVLALIYAVDPNLTADQAQQILFDSVDDLGTAGFDTTFGWGRVNAANAINVAQQRSPVFRLETLTNVYAYPNPWNTRIHSLRQVTIANVPDNAKISIFTLSGFWVKNLTANSGRALWDLTTGSGESVASGLYFYLVTSPSAQAKGTIAIIK